MNNQHFLIKIQSLKVSFNETPKKIQSETITNIFFFVNLSIYPTRQNLQDNDFYEIIKTLALQFK
jgi:hypothetical protein